MLSLLQCWAILIACVASATAGSVCIKASNVYKEIVPSVLMFVFFIMAVSGFPFAFSRIDLGTAYAGTFVSRMCFDCFVAFDGSCSHHVHVLVSRSLGWNR